MKLSEDFPQKLMIALINRDDSIPNLKDTIKVLNTLPDDIRDIVVERINTNKSFKQMGDRKGLSGNRIGQIYHKGIRMLHSPDRLGKLIYKTITLYEYDMLKTRIRGLENIIKLYERNHKSNYTDKDMVPIECLDLSVRAYNCLKRACIHYVYQVKLADLNKVRNLGDKSRLEIIHRLKEFEEGDI